MSHRYLRIKTLVSPLYPQFSSKRPPSPPHPWEWLHTNHLVNSSKNSRHILIPLYAYLLFPIHFQVLWAFSSKTHPEPVYFSPVPLLPPWQLSYQLLIGLFQRPPDLSPRFRLLSLKMYYSLQ